MVINRKYPSWWEQVRKQPYKSLAQSIYKYRRPTTSVETSRDTALEVVCISDTHNRQPDIPIGNLLIHAGDLTQSGSLEELQRAIDWLHELPHEHKVVIAGNHDLILDTSTNIGSRLPSHVNWRSVLYLQEQSLVLHFNGGRSLSIYGSPFTRKHGSWCFQYNRGEDLFTNKVPDDTDILVTHSPPSYHLDLGGLGDYNLLQEIWRVRPKLHVCGHIHAGRGQEILVFDSIQRHYEDVCHGDGGAKGLLLLIFALMQEQIFGRRSASEATTMVNAASIGGARDDILRDPITVLI